ncbi:MAG: DUF814 domain-containing protein [Desulfobacteraceae bacterium]|jgi:tRNA U34 2-thiouridine synthase MnmA/TrmU|nr:MAG: DUF814 domain-containing protein [Desulfobacteraceae bacterium]
MKALCVFSGGLDSLLTAELLRKQGIDVLAVFFETPFFKSDKAVISSARQGFPFTAVDITDRHLKIVKAPPHGYGSQMNPCIDCHALMFRVAGELLEKEKASFVATGEVLGQRPFSQNRNALSVVAAESGIPDLLLRPLSAKRLPLTLPEREGWVKRDLLLDLQGRSRKPQMELAKRFGITEYEAPAGGCILTDKTFSRRLRDLMESRNCRDEIRHIELLLVGRHLRTSPLFKIIVGRDHSENEKIRALAQEEDFVMTAEFFPGPTVLITGCAGEADLNLAASITLSYSDAEKGCISLVRMESGGQNTQITATALPRESFRNWMI